MNSENFLKELSQLDKNLEKILISETSYDGGELLPYFVLAEMIRDILGRTTRQNSHRQVYELFNYAFNCGDDELRNLIVSEFICTLFSIGEQKRELIFEILDSDLRKVYEELQKPRES
ncbi:MAG: hypothetical protein OEZ58_21325 [Gammaproteobacteria bacterium]|nr:hypothetical protein [Gammaproteobacteria bacterium]